jgi:hypothetical protein
MLKEEKIKEIRKLLRKGEPHGELMEKLKKEGYSEDDIAKIFIAHKYDMRSWYLTFGFVFLFVGGYALLKYKSFLLLVFSALLFVQYMRETKRLKQK